MSALGQKRTLTSAWAMSALPPKADIGTQPRNVRFVPKADIKAKRCASAAADTGALVQAPDIIAIKALWLQLGAPGNNSRCSRPHGGTLFIRSDRGDLGDKAGATLESHVTPQPGHGECRSAATFAMHS